MTLHQLTAFDRVSDALAAAVAETPERFLTHPLEVDGVRVLTWHGDAAYDDGIDRAATRHRLWMTDGTPWRYERASPSDRSGEGPGATAWSSWMLSDRSAWAHCCWVLHAEANASTLTGPGLKLVGIGGWFGSGGGIGKAKASACQEIGVFPQATVSEMPKKPTVGVELFGFCVTVAADEHQLGALALATGRAEDAGRAGRRFGHPTVHVDRHRRQRERLR